jgi:hypothetical protein
VSIERKRPLTATLANRNPSGKINCWTKGMASSDASDARRLKALEDENARLKKLLADQMLDNAMLRDIASKKW